MRVMFWSESFWPYLGGVETFGARLVSALHARGHEIAVVTSHGSLGLPDEDAFAGVPVHRFPFVQALAEGDARRVLACRQGVAALKRRLQPDVVHVNVQDPSVFFHLHTAAAWPSPTLLTVHGEFRDCGAGPDTLLGHALRSADWVSAVSRAMLDDVRALAPEIAERSSLVYNACPVPRQPVTPASTDPPSLVCLGRQVRDKGFDVAIEAMARVLPRHPRARLVFASDGPERSALERQAQRLGVAHAVGFRGWLDESRLQALIDSASAVVMPSRWREGFGLVALEAALRARPVAGTRVGGLPEVVLDGVTGLLVDNEDSEALAGALCRLLGEPGLAARLGQTARERALARFDFDAHVTAYETLYRRLAAQAASSPAAKAHARSGDIVH
jgi:glycogen(starch) synthase